MKSSFDELDPILAEKLETFRRVPERDPHLAASGRANFLADARIFAQAVSETENVRHISWIEKILQTIQFRKERFPMSALATVLLVITLLAGGTGGTVYASQSSMPDELLYPVKTLSEEVRMELAADPEAKLSLAEEFANRRVEEIAAMIVDGEVPPAEVLYNLQQQNSQSLQYAAAVDDEAITQVLLQLQDQLHQQDQIMQQLHLQVDDPQMTMLMDQTQDMLQTQTRAVEDCLNDPILLRDRLSAPEGIPERTPGVADGAGPDPEHTPPGNGGPDPERTPQGNGGPDPERTPQGDGDGTCLVDGECDPVGDANQGPPSSDETAETAQDAAADSQGEGQQQGNADNQQQGQQQGQQSEDTTLNADPDPNPTPTIQAPSTNAQQNKPNNNPDPDPQPQGGGNNDGGGGNSDSSGGGNGKN